MNANGFKRGRPRRYAVVGIEWARKDGNFQPALPGFYDALRVVSAPFQPVKKEKRKSA